MQKWGCNSQVTSGFKTTVVGTEESWNEGSLEVNKMYIKQLKVSFQKNHSHDMVWCGALWYTRWNFKFHKSISVPALEN
jgi:hypothetical protein